MDTLAYLAQKFSLDLTQKSPIEILKVNRTIMAETLKELDFTMGAEIGVLQGVHAEILCKANPRLLLYAIDAWEGYRGYLDYKSERLEEYYQEAVARLKPYNCFLIRKFSVEAARDFRDGSLDFVYIDGAHDFQSVTNDIAIWSKKIRPGGILYGHDFKRSTNPKSRAHVVDVVQGWTYANKINPWFILGTKGKWNGEYQEGTRSWMWVC